MKARYIIFLAIYFSGFVAKADVFTVTMNSTNSVPLLGSGWIITDTLGNSLASHSSSNNVSDDTTTVNVVGGPYLIQMYNGTVESVFFNVSGSSPSTFFLIAPLSTSWIISNKFWASFPAPVSFGNIEAYQYANFDCIHFKTYTESNCKKFILQKSSNGNEFIDIDVMDSKSMQGNSSEELNYVFYNYSIEDGEVFYRIKQLDYDEKASYSKIVSLERKAITNGFNIYPNPIKDFVELAFEKSNATLLEVNLFDFEGNFIKRLYSGSPINKLTTSLNEYSNACYFIQVVMDNKIVYSKSVVKK